MRKKFSVNLLFLLAVNLLIKPLYIFGVEVPIQNTVGAHDYGLFFSIFNFTLLFQIILELGLTNLIRRDISEHRNLARKYLKYLFSLKIILLPAYIITVLIIAALVGYDQQRYLILGYCLLIQAGLSFLLFIRAMLAGYGAYKSDSLLSVADKLILLVICGLLLYVADRADFTLYTFLNSYVMSIAVALLLGLILMGMNNMRLSLSLKPVYLRLFIRKALPYAIITFLMAAYSRLDSIYLERMLPDGAYQAGIYAAGFRLLDAYLMFALLFANLGLPMLASLGRNNADKIKLFTFILNLLMPLTLIGALAGWIFRKELTVFFYHHSEPLWYNTVGILLLAMIPIGWSMITGMAVLTTGKLKQLNILFIIGIILNVVINFILIPRYFAAGAALSSLVVNIFIAIFQYLLFFRLLGLAPDLKLAGKLLLYMVLFFAVASGIYMLELGWQLRFLLAIVLGGIIALLAGFYPVRKWLEQIR